LENKRVLIIGGGLEGVRTAIEKAEAGAQVTLVEKFPTLGAERIPRDRLIKPDNAFINPDLDKVRNLSDVRILTNSEFTKVTREGGKVHASVLKKSLRVDNSKCNDCKACIKVCPVNMFDDFDEGYTWRTAVDYFNPATGEYNIFKEDMPACQSKCPVHLDIRRYVGQIADGKYLESLATIRERLPLPGSIGRICPHPCETACNRQYLDESISICFLKRYVADVEINEEVEPVYETPEKKHPEKIAVVGAGPAGLTCAYDLAMMGYGQIKIFEALPVPGGYLWVGIPEYRLPKKLLKREVDLIAKMGVEIQYNARIGKDISFEDLINDYDAVISMACGAGVQFLAEMYDSKPIYPALNTQFIGVAEREGEWSERCRACGDCVLADTGGICPVAICPKGLLNGPCGGTNDGKCELSKEKDCAWTLIYNRLDKLGKLDNIRKIFPAKKYSVQTTPGRRIHEAFKEKE